MRAGVGAVVMKGAVAAVGSGGANAAPIGEGPSVLVITPKLDIKVTFGCRRRSVIILGIAVVSLFIVSGATRLGCRSGVCRRGCGDHWCAVLRHIRNGGWSCHWLLMLPAIVVVLMMSVK